MAVKGTTGGSEEQCYTLYKEEQIFKMDLNFFS